MSQQFMQQRSRSQQKPQDYPGISYSKAELAHLRPRRGGVGFDNKKAVKTQQWGSKRSVYLGQGMEFAESRLYQPGDDVKNIDWRVTARVGETHIKLFQAERERPIMLLLDLRSMMHFGSRVRFKSHMAAQISAQLAWLGHDAGDRVGALILTRSGMKPFKARRGRRGILQLLATIAAETQPLFDWEDEQHTLALQEVSLTEALRQLRHLCRTSSLVFMMSDFNDFDAAAEQELQRLSRNTQTKVIRITDPLDSALPVAAGRISDGRQSTALAGIEQQLLQNYSDAFAQRTLALTQCCRQNGMSLQCLETADDPRVILADLSAKHQITGPSNTSIKAKMQQGAAA